MIRRPRALAAALVAFLALSLAAVVSAPAAAATPDDLVINEIEQDGSPADWVELFNTSPDPVDASGLVLRDDKVGTVEGEDVITIPAETTIAGHGYLVVSTAGMGLGKGGDQARLFQSDGTTLIDGYTWTSDPGTSWGRCPDGTGAFAATTTVTPGAANDCGAPAPGYSTLTINEVQADGDWVELMNTGTSALQLAGLQLKDSGEGNTFAVPDVTLAAGAFLAVDVAGLGGGGDSARLFDGATLLDSFTWTSAADATWGRCPDGVGAFVDTDGPTKGAANDCPEPAGADAIVINEVESSGGDPADWIELFNTGATAVDLSGWVLRDNDDDHVFTIPAGASIPAGGYYVAVVDVPGGFGLGNDDEARLYLPGGTQLVDSRAWGPDHSPTTFGLCPDGTGAFVQTFTSTKGERNDCSPIRINEVDSNGATPVDWIELYNASTDEVSIGGYVLRDDDDDHGFVIAAGTRLAAGEYRAFDVDVTGGFGLGGADEARLFAADGATLLDTTSWTEHAATSWGRCPDATGAFTVTATVTKGAANDCAGLLDPEAWPGSDTVTIVDEEDTFDGDLSGLAYEASTTAGIRGTLWAVVNGGGILHKLTWNGTTWQPSAGAWADGTVLRYPDGSGIVDAEGVAFGGPTPASGVYVASERDDSPGTSGVSRPSVLRYDVPASPGDTLSATQEWNLTGIIPPVGNNTGLEGITWIPDSFLIGKGFVDATTGERYDPLDYPTHGDGLFFVGVEATGEVYALALGGDGSKALIATIDPKLAIVADVTFDAATGVLWAVCDEACQGRTVTLEIAQDGPFDGDFVPTHLYENPAGMADSIANEGFAIGTPDLCASGSRPVWYADDADTAGFSLREGGLSCTGGPGSGGPGTGGPGTGGPGTAEPPVEDDLTPGTENGVTGPASAIAGGTIVIDVGAEHAGEEVDVWIFSTPVHLGTFAVPASGEIAVTIPASLAAGSHRVAVLAADGSLLGWFRIAVAPAALGATGGAVSWGLVPVAAVSLLGGAVMLAAAGIRRRRRV